MCRKTYTAKDYPAQVQVTTSVLSLEKLCPGVAHQLLDPPEDGVTYPDADEQILLVA